MSALPPGWREVELQSVVEVCDSLREPVNAEARAKRLGPFPYYGANGQAGTIDEFRYDGEYVLVAEDGGYFDQPWRGVAYRVTGRFWVNNHAHVLRAGTDVLARFLELQLNTLDWMKYVSGTTRLKLTQAAMNRIVLRLPPLDVQRRIVAKLDDLLAQSRAAREHLEAVPDLVEKYRQSVLAAACSGTLTAEWRARHGRSLSGGDLSVELARERTEARRRAAVGPSDEFQFQLPTGWSSISLDGLTRHMTSGSRAWSAYYDEHGYGTFVMAQNVGPMRFDMTHRQGVAPPAEDPELERTRMQRQDLLVTIVGANTGDVCRVDKDVKDHFVCQSVAMIRLLRSEMADYVELWLNSSAHGAAQFRKWSYGEGRPHLSFDQLRATVVGLPPLDEQREIVREVRSRLHAIESMRHVSAASVSLLPALERALLAKAFSGELVT